MPEASTLSPAFVFTEYSSLNVTEKDEPWAPVPIEVESPRKEPRPLAGKFVYAFRKLGTEVQLAMEFRAGADGKLSVRDGRERRMFERDEASIALLGSNSDQVSLPHTINGRKALYFFLVTRIRLPANAIRQLESERPSALPLLDLSKQETFFFAGDETAGQSVVGRAFLGVIDPFTIALSLHRQYEQACNELLNFSSEFKEQSPQARDQVRGRHKTLLLARILKSVLEKDPADDLGLKNEFADGTGASVSKFVADYEQRTKDLVLERDRRGDRLCRFLRSNLLARVESLHLVMEEKDYNVYLDVMGAVHERLSECPPGRARLGALLDQKPHFLKTYVVPDGDLTESHFQSGRKSSAAIMNIWKEILPALIMKKGPAAPSIMVKSIELVTREKLVQVRQVVEVFSYRPGTGFKQIRATFDRLEIVQEVELRVRLERWSAPPAGGNASEAATKAGDRFLRGVEVVNLMLALKGVITADGSDQAKSALNLLGSTLDAVSAFNVLLRLSEKSIKVVGLVSAAIDAVLAAMDARDAYTRSDMSNVVGLTLVSTGSVIALIGCACALAGAGSSTTIVGLPLGVALEALAAILVAVGWLVSAFTADSEIELLVSHCKFGRNFGRGADGPKWADGKFAEWAQGVAGLDKQIRSLFNVLGSFSLKASDYTEITIFPGLLTADSHFEVSFEAHYNLGIVHRPNLLVRVRERTMIHAGGDPADLSKVQFIEDAGGRLAIRVRAAFLPGKEPENAFQHQLCVCKVRLQLGGDVPMTVPLSGAVVPFAVHKLGTGLAGSTVSSKTF